MSMFRYRNEERTNISKAESEARRNAALEAALAKGKVDDQVTQLANTLAAYQTLVNLSLADKQAVASIVPIATDAAETVVPSSTSTVVVHTGTLTANRTLTLSTTAVTTGSVIRFARTGSGAFSLSIGGLKNLTTNTWCDVIFNGTTWQLTASGAL